MAQQTVGRTYRSNDFSVGALFHRDRPYQTAENRKNGYKTAIIMRDDFMEFISLLSKNNADFVIVGAHALAFHGIPRYTGDIDILINPSKENSIKVLKTVSDFFGSTLGLSEKDLFDDDTIQFGRPPAKIDLLKKVTGVTIEEIWRTREKGTLEESRCSISAKK